MATQTFNGWSLTTTEIELTEGRHYWELELVSKSMEGCIMIGISRPNLNPTGACFHSECTYGWFTNANSGALCGNGKQNSDTAGAYKLGDRVGVLLDLDNGSLRFFKNGVGHGPGYAAGSVTGPVVSAAQFYNKDDSLRLLPSSEAPIDN